jgi:hypothetical protein
LVGDEDEIILDCYRLAKWFGVSPEVFLIMPLGEVAIHMRRAAQIDRVQHAVGSDDE